MFHSFYILSIFLLLMGCSVLDKNYKPTCSRVEESELSRLVNLYKGTNSGFTTYWNEGYFEGIEKDYKKVKGRLKTNEVKVRDYLSKISAKCRYTARINNEVQLFEKYIVEKNAPIEKEFEKAVVNNKKRLKERQFYLEQNIKYSDRHISIQLTDYHRGYLHFEVSNLSNTKIIETRLIGYSGHTNELGGESVYSYINGISAKDEFGNKYELRNKSGQFDTRIRPGDKEVFKISIEEPIKRASKLNLSVKKGTLGNQGSSRLVVKLPDR